MKKFLLLAFATLLVSPCVSETTIKSSSNKNLIEDNNNSIVSEYNEDKYTIRFLNDEGSVLSSEQYEFGVMPEAPTATPEKENPSPLYTYTFSGWSPSIALVTADVDYVATYKTDAKYGTVTWINGDGEPLSTDTYAYGSMPNYHGATPTKKATDTETYVFSGWNPTIETVSKPFITYEATFNPIPIPKTQYSIQINCTNCLVNKKRLINEKYNPLTDLVYQFNNLSDEIYHYPYKLDVTVNGESTNDYIYDNLTGKLNIKLAGDTVINAIADNSCVLMKYGYSADYPTVEITCGGEFERIDWGDGTTIDATNKSHTFSPNPDFDHYDIRIFGKLSDIGTTSKSITSVNVFHSVTSIRSYAFSGCSSLTSITIPNSVTSIGDRAFYNCSSLTSITIPNSVTSIGHWAFYYCSSLTSITIPDSVTSIGTYAFCDCSSLTSITIPDSVTSIRNYAFEYCSSLTINCEAESKPSGWNSDWNYDDCPVIWGYVENGEYNNFKYGVSLIGGNKSIVLIGLADRAVTSIMIPSTIDVGGENIPVTSIGDRAFYNCSSLTSITIPDSVTSIGNRAFEYCSSLTSITIPDSVTSIGNRAFYHCSSLTSITIPDSVTSIGRSAFYNCSSLTSITIPDSVTSIGSQAFYYCSSLTINCEAESKPSGWNSDWNYDDCPVIWGYVENGEYNNFKYGVSLIGGNKSIVLIGLVDGTATSITIPSTIDVGGENIPVTSIGNRAFYNRSYPTSISIPDSVTSIGGRAFSDCSSLTSINIPNSVTSIGGRAFSHCSSLTSITIPDSVTSIGEFAFSSCFSLTSITIPNSVTSIEYYTFAYCSKLTSITIPNSVTSIGSSAFSGCSSLTSITIPNSVTSIGSQAFYNCSSLETFDLSNLDHVIDIDDNGIFSNDYIPAIKVKTSMLDEYQSDYVWKRYKEKMVAVN